MSEYLHPNKAEEFAAYADKHEIFDMFEYLIERVILERPADVLQFMIDTLRRPKVPGIVIIGPPNSGHVRICEAIARHYDAVYISASQLLRTAVEKGSTMGVQAKPYMEKGQLVPDVIMTGLLATKFQQDPEIFARGYVMEGFPLTKEQAFYLQKKGMLPTHIVLFDVTDEVIISRTIQTRVDPVTGHLYHPVFNPHPRNPIVEARLIQRTMDTEPVIRQRLSLYRKNIAGVVSAFQPTLRKFQYSKGIIGHQEEVLGHVLEYLEQKNVTTAPVSFRIVLSGLPGSGKTSIAEKLEAKYGLVLVSPRTIILEEISAKSDKGKFLAPFLSAPENAPESEMLELIVKRLQMQDCRDRGWILENYPTSKLQASALKEKGIVPNRVIWLSCSPETCLSRLIQSQNVNDSEDRLKERIQRMINLKSELEKFYGMRINTFKGNEKKGLMQIVNAEETNPGVNKVDTVFEKVEGSLLR